MANPGIPCVLEVKNNKIWLAVYESMKNQIDALLPRAFHEAVMAQKIDITKMLLEYGAFVNVPGSHYETPLHLAVQKQNVELVKLLVKYGADLMMFNKDGRTPLDLCNQSEELTTALCLTPRRAVLYKIYTIPAPKVFCSNVSDEYIKKLSNISGITVCTEHNLLNIGDVTYFIIEDEFDVMQAQAAILQGACVVNVSWVNNLIAKDSPINPVEYIALYPKFAFHKAFMNSLNKLPRLFDSLQFYLCDNRIQNIDGYKYTVEHLKKLIHLGGGKILTRRPNRLSEQNVYSFHSNKDTSSTTVTDYLIYNEEKPNYVEHVLPGTAYKSTKWLIDCINSFSIIN